MPTAPLVPQAAIVVLAAGEGRRVGADTSKVLLPLNGRPVFAWSVHRAARLQGLAHVVLVVRPQDREQVAGILAEHVPGLDVVLVDGGSTRHQSEWNALSVLASFIEAGEVEVVALHDAARPLAGHRIFGDVITAAMEYGGAVPVRRQPSLISVDRERDERLGAHRLVAVQTPQAFRAGPLLEAYRAADREGFTGTDTAACVERYTDVRTWAVASDGSNIKITFPEDVLLAECLSRK